MGETQRNLLDGPSAYALARIRSRYTAYWLILPVAGALLGFSGLWIQWLMTALSLIVGITLIPLLVLLQVTVNKMMAEVEAGYTTFPATNAKVEQRDPYLGRVIRAPGAPYLDADQFKEIAARARAEATGEKGRGRTSV